MSKAVFPGTDHGSRDGDGRCLTAVRPLRSAYGGSHRQLELRSTRSGAEVEVLASAGRKYT